MAKGSVIDSFKTVGLWTENESGSEREKKKTNIPKKPKSPV